MYTKDHYLNYEDVSFQTNYEVLFEAYERLSRNPNDSLKGLEVYHSSVGYIHSLVSLKWPTRKLTYQDIARMMVEEEMTLTDASSGRPRPVRMSDLVTKL